MLCQSTSFEIDVPGVTFDSGTNKWRVRSTSLNQLSFGQYPTKKEALEVSEQVSAIRSKAEAFRVRDSLGIKGRGQIAKLQRASLAKEKSRLKQKQLKQQVVSV